MGDNHVGERPSSNSIFGEDGKLSSASAATSLKYAHAQDLPSFPSTGGVQLSSAGAAASLASSNKKSFEHWKPGPIPAANKAAMLAKDHKMDPLWQPEASAAGSRAAMMAAAHPIEVEPMQPKKAATSKPSAAYDTAENTHKKAMMAATAVHNRRRSGSMPTQSSSQAADAAWALKAATQSHKAGPPVVSQDFAPGDPGFEAARIQNVAKNNVNRQLYTSAPPVSIEVQEKNRQDTLKASAMAMAQKMYAMQQKAIDEAAGKAEGQGHALAASRARGSTVGGGTASGSDEVACPGAGYENLEEAARRLAQERLAKIHDEHAEYRNYYGQSSPSRSRLSTRLSRRRASSAAGADDDSDEEQSRRIKSQMSIFQSKLAEVDTKKRQQDRDNLLEIAHRNVDARISKMDEKVFQDTGKASPAQAEKWEKAAREKAQQDSDTRMLNHGKVHIGGGKYLDQSELDAIARARLQPTLDDISEKAEKQRARDEEVRLERERQQEQAAKEKARADSTAAQVKAEHDREKQQERSRKEEEKRIQREQDNAEKERRKTEAAAEKERARLEKEEKRRSKDAKSSRISGFLGRGGATTGAGAPDAATGPMVTLPAEEPSTSRATPVSTEPTRVSTDPGRPSGTFHDQVTNVTSESDGTPVETHITAESVEEPTTTGRSETLVRPGSPQKSGDAGRHLDKRTSNEMEDDPASQSKSRGVKSWMKVKFGGNKREAPKERDSAPITEDTRPTEKSDIPRTDSMRDVAMAGKTTSNESQDMYGKGVSPERSAPVVTAETRARSPSISSLSSSDLEEQREPEHKNFSLGTTAPTPAEPEERGRSGLRNKLMKKIRPNKNKTNAEEKPLEPVVTNTTDDEFEEARDQFEEETLAPPPPLSSVATDGGAVVKTRSPVGSRERSRFTEEL